MTLADRFTARANAYRAARARAARARYLGDITGATIAAGEARRILASMVAAQSASVAR